MDPSDAASNSTPHDDLAAFFVEAMRLGEASPPSQEQPQEKARQRHVEMLRQRQAALAPPPSPEQQQYQRYAAMLALQAKMMRDLQITRQLWPYNPYASPIGSSSLTGYASPIAAASNAFGGYVPTQSASQYKSDAASGPSSSVQQPYTQSASQNQSVAASGPSSSAQQPSLSASQNQSVAASGPSSSAQQPYPLSASQYQSVAASGPSSSVQQPYPLSASQYQSVAGSGPSSSAQQRYTPSASQYQSFAASSPSSSAQQPYPPSASQYQSVAASGPSSSGQQPYALRASASQYLPAPSASSSTHTSQYYQQHYFVPNHSSDASSVPDYMSERSFHVDVDGIPPRRPRTLEETRSVLLSGAPMKLELVRFPDSAAHVVHLLLGNEEGGDDQERIRMSVFAGVRLCVHDFMDKREGREVLVALLRGGRYAEVHAIVQEAVTHNAHGRHSLLGFAKHDNRETFLKELVTAAAPYHELCSMLVQRFVSEDVMSMKHGKGDQLLHHCFATMPYQNTVVLVRHALGHIGSLLDTSVGSKCLAECLAVARGEELRRFQEILLTHAHTIARGEYSNYLLQLALEHGDDETKERLLDRLVDDGAVVGLALDCYGSYVAETCFKRTRMPERVLAAFLGLQDAQLARLVQGKCSNYVVHKLLDFCKYLYPAQTRNLAARIEGLPQYVTDNMYAKKVMRVARKVLYGHGRMYYL